MLAAILVVVALVCGFSIATTVYIDQQGTAGLRSELETRAGADLALRASLDLADNAQQQDDEVRAAIDRTFASTGIPFDVTRSIDKEAYFKIVATDESGPAMAATIPDIDSRVTFVSGAAAAGADEVAIQAVAAEAIGLEVGDTVNINDVPFTVSGTWLPIDSLDPRWYGDKTVVTGGTLDDGGTDRFGPFAITEEAWARFDAKTTATWTIVPRSIDDFTASNRGSVDEAWRDVKQEWRGTVSEYDSLVVKRRLARTLDEFAQRIEGLRAIEPVAAVLVAGSALVVLSQLVQLLVATRERETALFSARGQSPAAIARRSTVEVGVSAAIGAAVGVGAVALWLTLTSDVQQLVAVRSTAIIVPAVVVVGAIVFAAAGSYRSALSVTTASKGGRGDGRARRAAIPGAVILVTIAAALSVWQLRLYGSPLTPNAEGTYSIDPIAVIAPAAALVAVVLAALAAFPTIVTFYGKRTQGSGIAAHLSARTLARQAGRVAAPLVIVALAVGSATVGAAFSATWTQLFNQTAQMHTGADLRVSSEFDPLSSAQLDLIASTEGVAASGPFDVQTLSIGTVTGSIVSAAPDAVRELATTAGGLFSREDAAAAIVTDQPGPLIPEGATSLTLRVEALNFISPPRLSAWIVDPFGRLREVTFGKPTADDDMLTYTTDLTKVEGSAPGTLVSFDVVFASQSIEEGSDEPSWRLDELLAEVAGTEQSVVLDQFWAVDSLRGELGTPRMNSEGDGFALSFPLPSARMTASLDTSAMDIPRPGVLVTQRLATLLELEVGDSIGFSVRDSVTSLNAVVAGIVPAIPGAHTDVAVLMDIAIINHLHQRKGDDPPTSTDVWVKTDQPQQVRDALRPELPANTVISLSDDPVGRQVLGAASVALWAAALCCLLIALVAMGSASSSRLRWGRNDMASLRAIGLGAREQTGVVMREMALVLLVALVAGLAAGGLVSVLTVPLLARAAVDRAYLSLGTHLSVDWVGLALLLGALAAGIAVILADLSRRVRTIATTSLPSEENE